MSNSIVAEGYELARYSWLRSKIGRLDFFLGSILFIVIGFVLSFFAKFSPIGHYLASSFLNFSFAIGVLYASKKLDFEGTFRMEDLFLVWTMKNFKILAPCFLCCLVLTFFVENAENYLIAAAFQPPHSRIISMFMPILNIPILHFFILLPFVVMEQEIKFYLGLKKVLSSLWDNFFIYSFIVFVFATVPTIFCLWLTEYSGIFSNFYLLIIGTFLLGIGGYQLNAVASYSGYAFYKKYL